MRTFTSLLLLLLLGAAATATTSADEEWSWSTSGVRSAGASPATRPSSATSRRSRSQRKTSGRVVFEDEDGVKGRRTRVDLADKDSEELTLKVTNSGGSSNIQRLPLQHFSFQTVDKPTVVSVKPLGAPPPIPIQIPAPVHVSSFLDSDDFRPSDDSDERHGKRIEPAALPDTQGRFMGIEKGLCQMGLGWNCKKGGGGYGGNFDYVNLDHLPVLPQPVYPPQYHSPPAPLPYGGGVDASQVFHVQPVALQPVGSPIQAIPLGPSGGKVPHAGPHIGPYAGPHIGPYAGPHVSTYGSPPHIGPQELSYGIPHRTFETHPQQQQHGSPPHITIQHHEPAQYGPPPPPGPPPPQHQQYPPRPPHHELQPSYPPHRESTKFHVIREGSVEHSFPGEDGHLVQHIHQHTHIYQGGQPSYSDTLYGGSVLRPSRGDRALPVVPPHPNALYETQGYREACECVSPHQCSSFDRVPHLPVFTGLDARTKKTSDIVYSNATASEQDTSPSSSSSSSASSSSPTEKNDNNRDKKDVGESRLIKKTKRDVSSKLKRQTNTFLKAEERRLRVGYNPGPEGCHRGDVCCRSSSRSGDVGLVGGRGRGCGRRFPGGVVARVKTPFHLEGDTEFGEYPWQAALLRHEDKDLVYVCGASLVDDRHLLTAAHCVHKLKAFDLQVRLGEWDVHSEGEFYPYVDFDVSDLIIHRDFYAGMLHHDIAIVRMARSVDFGKYLHISPVCLPEPHSHFEGQTCHVTGWGKDAFGKVGSFQQVLQKVDLPVVRRNRCEDALKSTRLGRGFSLHEGMMCAGGEEGKDACKGDGGGPLVCRGSAGQFELAGIVSWGIGCGERGVPGVYVDVAHYVDWIHEVIRF